MSDERTNALQNGKPVLRAIPEQRMPPDLEITVGMTVTVLDRATKNGTDFVRVRFKKGTLAHWIPESCIMASHEEAAA
jgi:hypothetical protein